MWQALFDFEEVIAMEVKQPVKPTDFIKTSSMYRVAHYNVACCYSALKEVTLQLVLYKINPWSPNLNASSFRLPSAKFFALLRILSSWQNLLIWCTTCFGSHQELYCNHQYLPKKGKDILEGKPHCLWERSILLLPWLSKSLSIYNQLLGLISLFMKRTRRCSSNFKIRSHWNIAYKE